MKNNNEALIWASKHGLLEVVKLLLENKANPNERCGWCLIKASDNGHLEVMKELLNNKNFNHEDFDYHYAMKYARKFKQEGSESLLRESLYKNYYKTELK